MERKQTDYNAIIGRTENGEILVLDYVFDHGDGFKGATGTTFWPVTKAQYDAAHEPEAIQERFDDIWRATVRDGGTDLGLAEWAQCVADVDGDDALFDLSGSGMWDEIREVFPEYTEDEYPIFECIGGGRQFSPERPPHEITRPDLWALIVEAETK